MKNDTQTHAANPADNATAQHTLEWHVELDAETDAPKSWPQGRAVCEGNPNID